MRESNKRFTRGCRLVLQQAGEENRREKISAMHDGSCSLPPTWAAAEAMASLVQIGHNSVTIKVSISV